jgi:hypothetical protein
MGTLIVEIPRMQEHNGYPGNLMRVEIDDKCPVCGGPRAGELYRGLSYDGSRRLSVDCWINKCGHVDKYEQIRVAVSEGTAKRVPFTEKTTIEKRDGISY